VHFCNKIFQGFLIYRGSKFPFFPLTLLVIVTTVRTAQPVRIATGYYSVLVSIATFVRFGSFYRQCAYVHTDIVITVHVHCQSQCSTLVQNLCHLPCHRSAHHLHYCLQTDCLVLLTRETSQMSSVRFQSSIHTAMDRNLDFFVWCLHYPR